MSQHYQLSRTKQQYREIFHQAQVAVEQRLAGLREGYHCNQCHPRHFTNDVSLFEKFSPDCNYRNWQKAALQTIEQEIAKDVYERLQLVESYKNTFECHMCGVCCRMASSEHSYQTLLKRAEEGDTFAQQFTGIFLPYASREAARQKYPEVVSAVLAEAQELKGTLKGTLQRTSAGASKDGTVEDPDAKEPEREERIYFYHCPYIGEDNRCTIYGTDKRPGICASYPETPLAYVYEKCAWKPWKDETHQDTLLAHALLNLCVATVEKIKQALN